MMAKSVVVICIILAMHAVPTQAFNILLVGPSLPSHQLELRAVGAELVSRGHRVYSVMSSGFERKERITDDIIIELEYRSTGTTRQISSAEWERWVVDQGLNGNALATAQVVNRDVEEECSAALADQVFMSKIKAVGFDFAIVDRFLVAPCLYLIPYVLGIPYASSGSTFEPFMAGSPTLPSFSVPGGIFAYSDAMTFPQRLVNFLFNLIFLSFDFAIPGTGNITLLHKYAPVVNNWRQLQDKAWLHFVSRDHVLDFIKPTFPNIITTPALNVRPARPLMGHFAQLANASSQHGLIIVSFGSMGVYLPADIIRRLLNGFSRVNQTVIMRMPRVPEGISVPANVHLFPWIPQNDLLGHPNTRLFVTHCGNNGQYEALYHAVPMIGMPLWGDQVHNAHRMLVKGFGLNIDAKTFTSRQLAEIIQRVAQDDIMFKENVLCAATVMRDSPMTPQQTVAYWTEHVLRHGHSHLRSHALDLAWYEYTCTDVILLLAIVASLAAYIVYQLTKCIVASVIKVITKPYMKAPRISVSSQVMSLFSVCAERTASLTRDVDR